MQHTFRARAAPATARIVLGIVLTLLAVPAALVGALVIWLPHEMAYRTGAEGLTIILDRGLTTRERRFPRERITGVESVDLAKGKRRVGTSMPGYCVGTFVYQGIGQVWQATNCSNLAVLVTLDVPPGTVIVTPADRAAFRKALEVGEEMSFRPGNVREGASWLALKLLVLLPLPLVLALPAVFFVAPGKLTYVVRPGLLEVRTLLVRRRFPLTPGIARRYRPSGAVKIAGSAFPGYYTGLFSLDRSRARVFATSLKEGVLLEGEQRVFVTPEEPEQFLAVLAEHGASIDATPSDSEVLRGSTTRR